MRPLLPIALTAADLPVAELGSARLDGELFSLAGSWCPIDALDAPATRAGAITPTAPRHATAERLTAAWIFGLAPEPVEHQFCVDVGARIGHATGNGVQLREVKLGSEDVTGLGQLTVTTPLRTAVDLARWGPGRNRVPEDAADISLIADLLAYAGEASHGGIDTEPRTRTDSLLAGHRGVSFRRIADRRLHDAFTLLARRAACADADETRLTNPR